MKWDTLKPIVVLTAVCLVVSAALVGTYTLTKPVIDAANAASENEALVAVLPEGTDFEPVEVTAENVISAYRETNGAGYVVQAQGKGFGGMITVMVGIDANGLIAGTQVMDDSSETAGLGTNIENADFQAQYIGKDTALEGVEPISGATFSSKGFNAAVFAAYAAYGEIAGVVIDVPQEEIIYPEEEIIVDMLGADYTMLEEEIEGIDSAYQSATGYAFNVSSAGFSGDIHVLVAIDPNGAIIKCKMYQHTETENEYDGKDGTKLAKNSFGEKWIGLTGEISEAEMPAYSGATYTSTAYKACVRAAFDAFEIVKGA